MILKIASLAMNLVMRRMGMKSAHKTENVGPDNDTANNTSHGDDVDSQSSLPDNKNFPQ